MEGNVIIDGSDQLQVDAFLYCDLTCDGCSRFFPEDVNDFPPDAGPVDEWAIRFAHKAREQGWMSAQDGQIFCPACYGRMT